MALDDRKATAGPPLPPWPLMAGSLAMLMLAFGLSGLPGTLVLLRVILVVGGLSMAGGAIWLQPRDPRLILAGAALASFATWCFDPWWDSAILVLNALTLVGVVAAFLVGLPWLMGYVYLVKNHVSSRPTSTEEAFSLGQSAGRVLSKVLVSLLIVLHFGGIATAILSTPSAGSQPAWLAVKSFNYYRPYLLFAYLINAYKFYSPEPGPADLLFVRIEYDDGKVREFELPNRSEVPDPLAQEYTRRLTVATSIAGSAGDGPTPTAMQRRVQLGFFNIPLHPYLPAGVQYQPPDETEVKLLREYARHIAHAYPHPENPAIGIAGIKIYRVIHNMLQPNQMRDPDQSPAAKWTFLPFYQGEFTAEGVLKDPDDPLLYWLIPIFRAPRGQLVDLLRYQEGLVEPDFGGDYEVHNFFEKHKNESMRRKAS